MWQWIYQFFASLPGWGWVLMYAWMTYGGLRWVAGDLSGRITYKDPDNKGICAFFGVILNVILLLVTLFSVERMHSLQMMLVGVVVFLFRTALDFAVPRIAKGIVRAHIWCQATYAKIQAKRASSPKRIIRVCKERLAYASRIRKGFTLPTDSDLKSMSNLAQASGNMLALLRDLFALAKKIDHVIVAAKKYEAHFRFADAIFHEAELKEFAHLVGSRSVDSQSLGELRHRVQGAIEAIVLRCQELPTHVEAVDVDRQIEEIMGFQKYVGQDLIDSVESLDAMTDFETGRLHKRILAELDLGPGVSLTGPHTDAVALAPRARVQA